MESNDAKPLIEPGTFEALFDLSFTKFVTVRIVRLLYLLMLAAIAVGWLFAVSALFSTFGGGVAVVGIIGLTLSALVGVIQVRVFLELIVVAFRIDANTAVIASRTKP